MPNNSVINVTDKILSKVKERSNIIGIEVTTYCPLDCEYCTRKMLDRRDQDMSWQDFLTLKSKLDSFKRIVICGMGETMVYKHIYEAVQELKQKVQIVTSGSILIDYERLNRNKNVELVVFSVDAPTKEGMEAIAGNYNWSNLIQNLKGARGIARAINCTITEKNYEDILSLAEFAVKYKVNTINFAVDLHNKDREEVYQAISKKLKEAKKIIQKGRILYTDSISETTCMAWGKVVQFVNLHGECFPCCNGVIKEYVLGNLFKDNYEDIFMSDKYKEFKKGGMCKNDCTIFNDKYYNNRTEV